MKAHLDEQLNTTYSWELGAPAYAPPMAVPYIPPILEPGFSAYAMFYGVRASVYAAPVLIPTAAVGHNPWDAIFGGIVADGGTNRPPAALPLPPQVGAQSMA